MEIPDFAGLDWLAYGFLKLLGWDSPDEQEVLKHKACSLEDAARILVVKPRAVKRLIKAGKLQTLEIEGQRLVSLDSLRGLIQGKNERPR